MLPDPLIEIAGVTKDYRGLRPLRVQRLELRTGESVALLGFDAAMSEVLVNLVTAAQLPDEGEVRAFGRPTSSITAVDEWITELDRFGLVSSRAVLVDQLTVEQNLALPLTLEVENLSPFIKSEVAALADEVGLSREELSSPTGAITPAAQLRLRVGRALALRPQVILAEHPNAALGSQESMRFAADFGRVTTKRGIAALITTADPLFARKIAERVLELQPATGALTDRKPRISRWFS